MLMGPPEFAEGTLAKLGSKKGIDSEGNEALGGIGGMEREREEDKGHFRRNCPKSSDKKDGDKGAEATVAAESDSEGEGASWHGEEPMRILNPFRRSGHFLDKGS